MTELEIKKYLKQPYNAETSHLLYIYLRNDSKYYRNYFLPSVEYARKRKAKKDYNSVLFIQQVYNTIEKVLREPYFKKEYYDLPLKIDISTKYHVAKDIARYIESDYLD